MAERQSQRPTLGQLVRGARLGYHWSDKYQRMIRMQSSGPLFLIDICEPDSLPRTVMSEDPHRCWWDDPEVLDLIEGLALAIRGPHVSLYLDQAGKMLE